MSQPAEPSIAALGGESLSRTLQRHWFAMRPAFLTAAVMPVLVGTAWGYSRAGALDWVAALLALAATALVHGGTNVINDVGDEIGGSDRANEQRIFPYTGGSRFIQNGVMSVAEMSRWGLTLVSAAVVLGIALTLLKGVTIVVLGLIGVALGALYSLPPFRLASRGMGEIAVATGLGFMPVMGATWLQTGSFDAMTALVAVPTSMWVAAILLINEVPDIAADSHAGKRTVPVRIGVPATRVLYVILHASAAAAVAALALARELHWGALLLPVALLGLAIAASAGISNGVADRPRLRGSIEKTLAIHAVGSLWVAVWCWFSTSGAA